MAARVETPGERQASLDRGAASAGLTGALEGARIGRPYNGVMRYTETLKLGSTEILFAKSNTHCSVDTDDEKSKIQNIETLPFQSFLSNYNIIFFNFFSFF